MSYDMPFNAEDYLRRAACTAGNDSSGEVILLVAPHELEQLHGIEALIGSDIESVLITGYEPGSAPAPTDAAPRERTPRERTPKERTPKERTPKERTRSEPAAGAAPAATPVDEDSLEPDVPEEELQPAWLANGAPPSTREPRAKSSRRRRRGKAPANALQAAAPRPAGQRASRPGRKGKKKRGASRGPDGQPVSHESALFPSSHRANAKRDRDGEPADYSRPREPKRAVTVIVRRSRRPQPA